MVELLIVLAIMGIITSAIFSFLLFNMRTFNQAEDQLEVQYHAQMAMNKIIEKAVGCNKISHIYLSQSNYTAKINQYDLRNRQPVYAVTFEYVDGTKYSFRHSGTALYEGNSESATTLSSNYIQELFISPMPATESFKDAKGIEIEIKSLLNQSEVVVKNVVYFRNAD